VLGPRQPRRWNPASNSRQALTEANQRCNALPCTNFQCTSAEILNRFHPRVHFPPTFPHAPSHRPLNSRPQFTASMRHHRPVFQTKACRPDPFRPLLACCALGPNPPRAVSTHHDPTRNTSIAKSRSQAWCSSVSPMPDNFRSLPQAGRCLGSTGTARTAQWTGTAAQWTATACQAHGVGQQWASWGRCCPLWASKPLLWARTRTHLTLSSHHHLYPRRYSPPHGQGEPRSALT
jgi:hypothetical protein